MLTAVNNYADDTLLEIDDSLYKALSDVRRIRQNIMNSQHRNTSANDNPQKTATEHSHKCGCSAFFIHK